MRVGGGHDELHAKSSNRLEPPIAVILCGKINQVQNDRFMSKVLAVLAGQALLKTTTARSAFAALSRRLTVISMPSLILSANALFTDWKKSDYCSLIQRIPG